MKKRRIGKSGIVVSEIGLGTMTFGSSCEESVANLILEEAYNSGIDFYDTAEVYPVPPDLSYVHRTEEILGKWIQTKDRSSIILATKVAGPGHGWFSPPIRSGKTALDKHNIMLAIDGSLKRLKTDHIDLYQAHRFDFETPLEESLSAFDDLIRQGKVSYIGFSEWNASQISDALKIQDARGYNRFVSSQPQYSALWRVIEAEVVPLSQKEGIGQIVWSPMAQGVLTGKYLPGKKAPAGSRATDKKSGANFISRWMSEEVLTAVQKLKPIAKGLDISMSQLALAWVLQNSNVSSAI
ncbi:MAG: aldo/keto reductase, partial [Spirochaetia bacterium]|nr:aldo/keto reductase [Spirochaetia bacterium]